MSEHGNDPDDRLRPPLAAFAVAALGLATMAAALTAYSAEGLAAAVRLASVRYCLGLAALMGAITTIGSVAFLALGPLRRQREAQAERAQWRERCEDLLHALPDGVCLIDADFIVCEPVSPSLSAALRCKLWPGMDLVEALRPLLAAETVEALRAHLRQCFAARAGAAPAGRNPLAEATFPGPPSRPSHWGFRFEPVRHGERVAYLLVIATDIGERQRIARELAGARMRLRAQIDGLLRACLRDGLQIRSCLGHADAALERARVRLPRLRAAVGAAEREASLRSLLQEARTIKREAAEIELELLETPAHHLELDLLERAAAAPAGDEGARLAGHLELLAERIAMVRDFVVGLDARGARKSIDERAGERSESGAAAAVVPAPRAAAVAPASVPAATVAEPGEGAAFVARLRRHTGEPGSDEAPHDAGAAAVAPAMAAADEAMPAATTAHGPMKSADAPAPAPRPSEPTSATPSPRPVSAPSAAIAPTPVAERRIPAPVAVSVSPPPSRLADAAVAALVLSPQRSDPQRGDAAAARLAFSPRGGSLGAGAAESVGPEGPPTSPAPAADALAAIAADPADPFALVPLLALSGGGEAGLPADRAAFADWAALARRLAGEQGKAVRVEAVLDPFLRLPPARAAMLRDVGMELVANAVLHGIEPMSARRRIGKDPVGAVRLTLGFDEREGWLFCARDDGRGVDLARLRAALVSSGACTPDQAQRLSEREAIVKVFEPGVTTAMRADGARGHGLGLPNAVERLRGLQARVSLVTVPGRSTEVRIAWPPG